MKESPSISQLIDTLKYITFFHFEQLDAQYILPGASTSQIDQCEGVLGHGIPSDVWQFWSECGGEQGHLGIALGARVLAWHESMEMVLDNAEHFSDDGSRSDACFLPLLNDEPYRVLLAVNLQNEHVFIMSYPQEAPHRIDLEMTFHQLLRRLVRALLDNRGYYSVLPYIKYNVLVGDGSFLRYCLKQKQEQDEMTRLLEGQDFQ